MSNQTPPPDDRVAAVFRFATELIAWIATPWALARHSVILAVLSVIVLIGLPAVFGTPGDKKFAPKVAVPGWVTICLVLLQLIAAVWASWAAWWPVAAIATTLLAVTTLFTERRRWRWLLKQPSGR